MPNCLRDVMIDPHIVPKFTNLGGEIDILATISFHRRNPIHQEAGRANPLEHFPFD